MIVCIYLNSIFVWVFSRVLGLGYGEGEGVWEIFRELGKFGVGLNVGKVGLGLGC